jgi:hypothetical protein
MKYLSLDIETTGLDPETCQILQIAAVLDDTEHPLEDAPTFNALLYAPTYTGTPYALAMNMCIFETLARATPGIDIGHRGYSASVSEAWCICSQLKCWLEDCDILEEEVVLAGKNVAGFDLTFLQKLPNWNIIPAFHRVLDPGNLYLRPTDLVPPGTDECLRRAGLDDSVSHDALDDALAVCQLIRHWEAQQ